MMTQKQPEKKIIRLARKAKLTGAALMVAGLMTSPKASAQSASGQTFVSSYSGGSDVRLGLGATLSSDSKLKPIEASLSASAAFDGRLIKLETAELDIGAGPVLGYLYKDPFYGVKQGAGLMGFVGPTTIGAEISDGGVATGYVKYKLGHADAFLRPALAAVAWDGKIKKLVVELKMGAKISGIPFSLKVAEGILLQDGSKSVKMQFGADVPF